MIALVSQVHVTSVLQLGILFRENWPSPEYQEVTSKSGWVVRFHYWHVFMSQKKIGNLQDSISSVVSFGRVPVRLLVSIVGQIISMSLAIGSIAGLKAIDHQLLVKFNGQPIWFSAWANRVAFSDGSSRICRVKRWQWSEEEVSMSAAWTELKAVFNVIVPFAPKLQRRKIKWCAYNQSSLWMLVGEHICNFWVLFETFGTRVGLRMTGRTLLVEWWLRVELSALWA